MRLSPSSRARQIPCLSLPRPLALTVARAGDEYLRVHNATQDIYFYFFNQIWIFRKTQNPTFTGTFFRRHVQEVW